MPLLNYARLFVIILACLPTLPLSAWAADPISDMAFDGAKDKAKDVIARAESAGDAIAKAFGEQALKAIEALEKAASNTIGEAKDAVLESQNEIFDSINEGLDRIETDKNILITDITKMSAIWANQLARIPFIDARPEVMMYQPRVLIAQGNSIVPLRIIGPKLSTAEATLKHDDTLIELGIPTDQELLAKLDRSIFEFPPEEPDFATLTLNMNQAEKSWRKIWTWWQNEPVTRDITVMLLPQRLAKYRIETKLDSTTSQTKIFTTRVNSRGKDSLNRVAVPVPQLDLDAGWFIDTTSVLGGNFSQTHIDNRGGSSCAGFHRESLTTGVLVFQAQIGHVNKPLGGSSDGWVTCEISFPLIKTVPAIIEGPTIEGEVSWNADADADLPANLNSYAIYLSLFNAKEYIIRDGTRVPYGMIEIERTPTIVHFRPKPPIDF